MEAGNRLIYVDSFSEWYASQRLTLLRFATNLCGDRQAAQDLLQDVALRAHARWTDIEATRYPNAYLRRMVVNEFISWRRKWGRIVPVGHLTDIHVDPSGDHATRIADQQQLRTELQRLPRRQQAVLVLRYFEGLDDATIAEILGTRPVTVRAYASRALARLRIQIAEDTRPSTSSSRTRPSLEPIQESHRAH